MGRPALDKERPTNNGASGAQNEPVKGCEATRRLGGIRQDDLTAVKSSGADILGKSAHRIEVCNAECGR